MAKAPITAVTNVAKTLVSPQKQEVADVVAYEVKGFKSDASVGGQTRGRRRVPRRTFEAPVGVLLHGKFQIERAFQMGEGGMMISHSMALAEGTQLVVSFYLSSDKMVMVRGIVRSIVKAQGSSPERYGLEFLNLGFQYKREIRNFVAAATQDGHLSL